MLSQTLQVVPEPTSTTSFVAMQHWATLLYAMSVSNSWTGSQSPHDTVVRITTTRSVTYAPLPVRAWTDLSKADTFRSSPWPKGDTRWNDCRRVLGAFLPCQLLRRLRPVGGSVRLRQASAITGWTPITRTWLIVGSFSGEGRTGHHAFDQYAWFAKRIAVDGKIVRGLQTLRRPASKHLAMAFH